jgi:hypothetical protein
VLSRASSGADFSVQRRSDQLAMFRITTRTCGTFTLAEVLIMAAMNLETSRMASAPALPEGHAEDWLLRTASDAKAGAALSS